MSFILHILLQSIIIYIVAKTLPTIHIKNFWTAIVVSLVYGIINFLIGWLLRFLAMPFIFLTFGLFTFVVNAVLLWITDKLIEDFRIDGFGSTLIAALLITVGNWLIDWLIQL